MYKSHIGRAVNLTQERIDAMVNKGAWQNRLIIDYFDKWAEETPDKAAIVAYSVETGERQEISYGELQALSFQIAHAAIAGRRAWGYRFLPACQPH